MNNFNRDWIGARSSTPSDRWGDPRAKLLQGQAWEAARSHVCRTLNLSATAGPELTKLAGHLDETYRKVAANLATNTAVELERVDGKDRLSLGRLDKLDEPPSLAALRDQVDALIPIERTVPHDRTRLHEYNIVSPRC